MVLSVERCAARSQARGESMSATASTVRRWLLLEHHGPWGERALLDARLPEGLGRQLRRLDRRLGIRVLLIRRPDRDVPDAGSCFAISSDPDRTWIERARLRRRRDVLDLDLEAFARGERLGLDSYDGPLFAVCTHGRHDPCCAERGRPLAQWLSVTHPEQTWESTHVGGDRFAANLVAFPHGWYFGRVEADAGPVIADAYLDGRVDLAHARGRSCFPIDVQAAELFLRTVRGLDALDDVTLRRVDREAVRTTAVFGTPAGAFAVAVERSSGDPVPLTCRAIDPLAPPVFALVGIQSRDGVSGSGASPRDAVRP
jgi:hypothetical protein